MYYLISTINASVDGWGIYGRSRYKRELENKIDELFKDKTPLHRDIYNQTLYKNSRVVSKTAAKRYYKIKECDL